MSVCQRNGWVCVLTSCFLKSLHFSCDSIINPSKVSGYPILNQKSELVNGRWKWRASSDRKDESKIDVGLLR